MNSKGKKIDLQQGQGWFDQEWDQIHVWFDRVLVQMQKDSNQKWDQIYEEYEEEYGEDFEDKQNFPRRPPKHSQTDC